MKTLTRTIFLILVSSTLYGQDLTGQWNGTLNVQGNQFRVIFHVIKTNNQFKATMDSPDQNVSGTPVTAINFNYPSLKFEISDIGMVYEGVLSGSRITGKWMQSGQSFYLVLSKVENMRRE